MNDYLSLRSGIGAILLVMGLMGLAVPRPQDLLRLASQLATPHVAIGVIAVTLIAAGIVVLWDGRAT